MDTLQRRRRAVIGQGTIGRSAKRAATTLLALSLVSCSAIRYAACEKLGVEKRDLLQSDVEKMKDEQKETAEQFQDALTKLRTLYGSSGSDLEQRYDATKSEYEDCETQANALQKRMDSVRTVANDLFDEWQDEIDEMGNEAMKRDSKAKLVATRKRFEALDATMRRSEQTMKPVLKQFRDQVLYLKHNLNAEALGTLSAEVTDIDKGVSALVERMQQSIQQADTFLQHLQKS